MKFILSKKSMFHLEKNVGFNLSMIDINKFILKMFVLVIILFFYNL